MVSSPLLNYIIFAIVSQWHCKYVLGRKNSLCGCVIRVSRKSNCAFLFGTQDGSDWTEWRKGSSRIPARGRPPQAAAPARDGSCRPRRIKKEAVFVRMTIGKWDTALCIIRLWIVGQPENVVGWHIVKARQSFQRETAYIGFSQFDSAVLLLCCIYGLCYFFLIPFPHFS